MTKYTINGTVHDVHNGDCVYITPDGKASTDSKIIDKYSGIREYLNRLRSTNNNDEYISFLNDTPISNLNISFFNTFSEISIERFMGMLMMYGVYTLQRSTHRNESQIREWEYLQLSNLLAGIVSKKERTFLELYAPPIMKIYTIISKLREILGRHITVTKRNYHLKSNIPYIIREYPDKLFQRKFIKSIREYPDIIDEYISNLEWMNPEIFKEFIDTNIISREMIDAKSTRSDKRFQELYKTIINNNISLREAVRETYGLNSPFLMRG